MKTFKVYIIRSCTGPLRINLVLTWNAFANAIRTKLEQATERIRNRGRTDKECKLNEYVTHFIQHSMLG